MRFLVADHWPLARWPGPDCSLVMAGLGEGHTQQRVRSGMEMTSPPRRVGPPLKRRSWRVLEGAEPLAGRGGREAGDRQRRT